MTTLDTHRKQAKLLLRWHRENNYSIGGKVRQLERFRSLTDREALALNFTLALAQEIIAVEAGYTNWTELKMAKAETPKTPRPSKGPPVLKGAIPVLLVRNVELSAEYFKQKLGFEIDFLHGLPPFYGAVSRDDARLHLRFVHQGNFAEVAAREKSLILASIEVSNVQELFGEFKARGAEFAQEPIKQAWGGTDFHVRDLDGNVIAFVTYG